MAMPRSLFNSFMTEAVIIKSMDWFLYDNGHERVYVSNETPYNKGQRFHKLFHEASLRQYRNDWWRCYENLKWIEY